MLPDDMSDLMAVRFTLNVPLSEEKQSRRKKKAVEWPVEKKQAANRGFQVNFRNFKMTLKVSVFVLFERDTSNIFS